MVSFFPWCSFDTCGIFELRYIPRRHSVTVETNDWFKCRNAPFILGTRAIALPIAAGNTVVFKGSELSPKCFWALGDVFRQAGLPAGVLNVIFHQSSDAAAVTNALIAHPYIRKVNFTGSTLVGSIIASTAGKYIKPVLLELGGKASAVVLDDADLDRAAMNCAIGSFMHVSIRPNLPCYSIRRSIYTARLETFGNN